MVWRRQDRRLLSWMIRWVTDGVLDDDDALFLGGVCAVLYAYALMMLDGWMDGRLDV